MPLRLLVIDGADQGRFFPLADAGALLIGNSRKHADVCLNDLYVSRVHCQFNLADGKVTVQHLADQGDTFVNGKKVAQQVLKPGDVVRIGNSHLRLEDAEPGDVAAGIAARAAERGKLPVLDFERLDELTNHVLGHYELGLVIGRGRSSIIFQAHDLKIDATVALKVLSPEFPQNDAEMQAFVKAMRAVLPLRHPCLLTTAGVGKTGPYCWIAREFLQADSLDQLLPRLHDARKIDWRMGLHVAYQVARALDFIHGRHLMHGNITPGHILFQEGSRLVKVTDLMLNKALDGSALQQRILESQLLAELPYLAPEQLTAGAYVDNLCDIYGLGAVVYALLTGRPPFSGEAPDEVLAKIRSEPPEHPKIYQRSIPSALDRMVMKMLAKQQIDRYPNPTALLEELEAIAEEHDEPLRAGESTVK